MRLIILRTFSRRRGDGSTVTYRRGDPVIVDGLSKHIMQMIRQGLLARAKTHTGGMDGEGQDDG